MSADHASPPTLPLLASTERVLELGRLYELLAGRTQTSMGASTVRERRPLLDADAASGRHEEWRQMRDHVVAQGTVGLAAARPLGELLARAAVQGRVLDGPELLRVGRSVSTAGDLRRHLSVDAEQLPALAALGESIPDLDRLGSQIDDLLDADGEVRDDASPRLSRLRGRARSLRGRLRERLEELTRREDLRDALRDSLVTERGGRLVVPVRSDHRERVQGIVHDSSSSGQTLYVEPLEAVDEQNRLAEIAGEEREEVRRLLAEATAHVRAASDALRRAERAIARADCLQALARYALETTAVPPIFVNEGLRVRQAIHPLADREQFVPLDLEIDAAHRGVVITGPNTGGKTVCLATLGLMALMAQAGLPLPATEVRLPCFARVHADIGDEQSLETSLSTFSSHLTHIAAFLEECPRDSLVLLDELGTGTDPEEGAALGIALLERFLEMGALVLVSTHHDALKSFAHEHDAALNAAMEFDPQTLEPTYRIRMGEPGRSNALEIASRLGLDETLVRRARSLLGAESVQLDEVIRQLEVEREHVEQLRARLHDRERELREARERADAAEAERARRYEEIEQAAREAVKEAAEQVRREGSERLDRLERQESGAVRRSPESERSRADRRARWAGAAGQLEGAVQRDLKDRLAQRRPGGAPMEEGEAGKEAQAGAREEEQDALRRGESVRVAPFDLAGSVLRDWDPEADADTPVEVDVGGKRVLAPRGQLRRDAGRKSRQARRGGVGTRYERRSGVRPEIDLHGMRVDEALTTLERYLDDAMLADLSTVRLIHGFGTLALRDAIHRWLAERPGVRSYGAAEPAEGGAGVTVVRLAGD